MTMPYERYRAIAKTEEFLKGILRSSTATDEIKDGARWCLRHYPTKFDLDNLADAAPYILQKEFKQSSQVPSVQWQNLTEAELRDLRKKHQSHDAFARAIEEKSREKNCGLNH